MLNDKVLAYIQKELKKGYKPELVHDVLVEKGYDKAEVKKAIEKTNLAGDTFERLKKVYFSNLKDIRIKKPSSKVIAFVIIPVCLLLLGGAIIAQTKRVEDAAHLFRSLFILLTGTFIMTGVTQKIGERLNFTNKTYSSTFRLILSAGLLFVFLEYFFKPGIVLLSVIPAFAVLTLLFRKRFVNDLSGAVIASTIIIILSFLLAYLLITIMAFLVKVA